MRALLPWGVCALALLAACGDDATEPATQPAARQVAAQPPKPAAPRSVSRIRQKMDDLGRLRPAADRVYGFTVPLGMELVIDRKGAQVYDYVAPIDRLVEFWLHRDYAVTKEARGWSVQHTPLTLQGQQPGLYEKARVMILTEGTNRAKLRFYVPRGPDNQLNPLNAEVQAAKAEPPAPAPLPIGPSGPSSVQGKASGSPVGAQAPPAEWEAQPELLHPAGVGRADASDLVREWMRRNPGRTFQD